MESFSWGQFLTALVGSGGVLFAVLKASQALYGYVEKRRSQKKAEAEQVVAVAIETRRLEIETARLDQAAVNQTLWEMVKQYKAEVDDLKLRLSDKHNADSLSHSVVTQVYRQVRKLRRRNEALMELIDQQADHEALMEAAKVLEVDLELLENALP